MTINEILPTIFPFILNSIPTPQFSEKNVD